MKKVFIIVTKGEIGGAQEVVFQLANGLRARGNQVTVGYGSGLYLKQELEKIGIPTVEFKYLKRTRNPFSNIFFVFEIKKYLSKHSVDVLHVHSSNALLAAWGAKHTTPSPKTIFTFHGMSFLAGAHGTVLGRMFYVRIFRFLMKWIDVPVAICQSDYDRAISLGLFKKGVLIPVGIAQAKLRLREDSQRILSLKMGKVDLSKKIVIGSIGRLAYPKNYEFLVSIASTLIRQEPELIFVIIGDGPEYKKYKRLVRRLHVEKQFFFVGELGHAAEFLSAFDVFVLTSLYEGTPVTLLEAMQAGLPVLAPAVGGVPEMLHENASQLFRGPDFEKKFLELVKNIHTRKLLSEQNKKISSHYSVERMIANYERIL